MNVRKLTFIGYLLIIGYFSPLVCESQKTCEALKVDIRPRTEWDVNDRGKEDEKVGPVSEKIEKMKMTQKIGMIIIHHSGELKPPTRDIRHIDTIHKIHIGKGMADIAYNYIITKDGKIYTRRSLDYAGGHTGLEGKGYNQGSIGICVLGNFEPRRWRGRIVSDTVTDAQKKSLENLLKCLCHQYNIVPSTATIRGHGEVEGSLCSGKDLRNALPEIIKKAGEVLKHHRHPEPTFIDVPETIYLVHIVDPIISQFSPDSSPGVNDTVMVEYYLFNNSVVSIQIYDKVGNLVTTLAKGVMKEAGEHYFVWDGKDKDNKLVPEGEYIYFRRS